MSKSVHNEIPIGGPEPSLHRESTDSLIMYLGGVTQLSLYNGSCLFYMLINALQLCCKVKVRENCMLMHHDIAALEAYDSCCNRSIVLLTSECYNHRFKRLHTSLSSLCGGS